MGIISALILTIGLIAIVASVLWKYRDKLAQSFTPELLQWTLYNKLGDKINVMILPAGQQFILDPNALTSNK